MVLYKYITILIILIPKDYNECFFFLSLSKCVYLEIYLRCPLRSHIMVETSIESSVLPVQQMVLDFRNDIKIFSNRVVGQIDVWISFSYSARRLWDCVWTNSMAPIKGLRIIHVKCTLRSVPSDSSCLIYLLFFSLSLFGIWGYQQTTFFFSSLSLLPQLLRFSIVVSILWFFILWGTLNFIILLRFLWLLLMNIIEFLVKYWF